jgi:hypothetical protein
MKSILPVSPKFSWAIWKSVWRSSKWVWSSMTVRLKELAQAGFDPVFGARPLKRAIQQQLENPLAKSILEGKFGPKDTIRVACENGIMRFSKA